MDKLTKFLLGGILICLIILALKPSPYFSSNPNINLDNGEQVIRLNDDKLAIIDTNINSSMRGTILVLDYDENDKKFKFESSFNYKDYFINPHKYGLK